MNKALDIAYKNKNGINYPNLQISNNPDADKAPLGKYGQMCLKFLKEEYPDRYAELKISGELMPLMHNVNEEAYRQINELTERLMEKEEIADKNDTIQRFKTHNICRSEAEEIVLREYVYKSR